jgi:hypothetical protein
MPVCPQLQSQPAAGRFVPQLGQKLLVMPVCPQGQSQEEAGLGSGRLAPQLGQKLLTICV